MKYYNITKRPEELAADAPQNNRGIVCWLEFCLRMAAEVGDVAEVYYTKCGTRCGVRRPIEGTLEVPEDKEDEVTE